MNNGELPEGWASTTIDSTFQLSGGGTPDRGNSSYWGGKVPWLSSGDIKTHRISVGSEFITKQGLANSSAKLCPAGSVVLVVRSGILKHTLPVAVLEQPAAINQDLRCMDSGNVELNAWLALALRASAREILEQNREGTTVQSVKTETIRAFPLKVPPLAEQRRIVAKVEELLARVHVARERLAKVPRILKRFRQAVLATACDGRLTVDWRDVGQQPSAAQNTLRASRTEIAEEDRADYPESWQLLPAEDLFDWTSGKYLPAKSMKPGSHPVYGGNGIAGSHAEYLVSNPTIVIGRVGALCGNVYITAPKAWVTDNAIYAKVIAPAVKLPFARLVFEHAELNRRSGGTGQPFVNQTILNSVGVPLPPLAEQHEIVRRVDALFALADKIGSRVQAATGRVERITQAILAKAFRGELVPTEAELARAAGRDYEPAAALLERIRAASASSAKVPRRRRHAKA